MTRQSPHYSRFIQLLIVFVVSAISWSNEVVSEDMPEASHVEAPAGDFGSTAQRLIEKIDELDEKHIMREKSINELRRLLTADGYRALDLEEDDIVAKLYLVATVHPDFFGNVLSYHKNSISQAYLDCLQNVESTIRVNMNYTETAADIEKLVTQMVSRVVNADLPSDERRNMTKRLQRLLFVLSLQQHARQRMKWEDTYYGKIESKLAAPRQELEQTFESMRDAKFESSLASVIILNWPAWSYTLTCGRNNSFIESSTPQPEQTPSLTPTSPSVVPRTEPNGDGSSPAIDSQVREKKVPTPGAPKKPHGKVSSQEWIQIR